MAKILVVAPTPFFSNRGCHIRILEESLALEKLGHQITIATYHIGEDIDQRIKTSIDVRRIRRLLFWYKKFDAGPDWQKVILDIMLIRKTFYLARTQRPDIIHGHLHEGVLIGWIVQKALFWRKMKLVADFQGSLTGEMLSHGYLKRGLKRVFALMENFINKLGDWAITSSWACTDGIKKSRYDGKAETILDGINKESFNIADSKEELKREWEAPVGKFIIGYTGGLVFYKGIDFLLKAMPLILQETKDVYFMIAGFPPEESEKFIRQNNLGEYARVISPLDYFKLPEFLKICDVAVDPKGIDTGQASGKILNYIAAGLPVVCFDKPNNRKYLGDGGQYCSQVSAQSLAEGILSLKNNPEERMRKGQLNKNMAEKYSWDISAKRVDEIYRELLK